MYFNIRYISTCLPKQSNHTGSLFVSRKENNNIGNDITDPIVCQGKKIIKIEIPLHFKNTHFWGG